MKKLFAVTTVFAVLSGCSSIFLDKTQQVNVSTPQGQKVTGKVNGQDFSAPGVVVLVRENKNKVFVTDAPDCKSETVAQKTVDPVFFMNVIIGGPLGSTVDYSTERMWKYADNVTLNCQ